LSNGKWVLPRREPEARGELVLSRHVRIVATNAIKSTTHARIPKARADAWIGFWAPRVVDWHVNQNGENGTLLTVAIAHVWKRKKEIHCPVERRVYPHHGVKVPETEQQLKEKKGKRGDKKKCMGRWKIKI